MSTEILNRITNLIQKAAILNFNGKTEQALQLSDEAIRLAEEANLDSFQLRIKRELIIIGNSQDFSGLIKILQDALDYYRQKRNSFQEIETLINLVGALANMGDKKNALKYLRQVENLLSSLNVEDIHKMALENSEIPIDMAVFVRTRIGEVKRLNDQLRS